MHHTILIAEDDALQRRMLAALLEKKLGYAVIPAASGEEALDALRRQPLETISAVLLDVHMPGMGGFEALRAMRSERPDLPVLMLTSDDDTTTAVRAIREGASDFIVKPPEPSHLDIALSNAIRMATLARELAKLKREKEGALGFSDMVGYAGGLASAVSYGRKAASSDVPVLIIGETGVGKELFARAIHGESRRVGAPFVAINCGAIPENLVESTLFGHEKGSFTGAVQRTLGKFREAEGGTIFLDEIGELPLEAQVKLLRVLQQKEVEPVGAGRPVKVNARIISATNRDLRRAVTAGQFREDLYFRLNVLPIAVPALRERTQDIIPLAQYFLQRLAAAENLPHASLSADAEAYLNHYHWPGNVRELGNLIHRALVLSDSESIDLTTLAHIHEASRSAPPVERRTAPPLHVALRTSDGTFKKMESIETEAMRMVLAHYEGNVTRAAEALAIAKSTFYRKIKDA